MIKPIVYHSFQEKAVLEKELMNKLSPKRRTPVATALMDIFYAAGQKSRSSKVKSKSKKHVK